VRIIRIRNKNARGSGRFFSASAGRGEKGKTGP